MTVRRNPNIDHAFVVVDGETIVDAAHKQLGLAGEKKDVLILPRHALESRAKIWANGHQETVRLFGKKWNFSGRSFKRKRFTAPAKTMNAGASVTELANEAYGFAIREGMPSLD